MRCTEYHLCKAADTFYSNSFHLVYQFHYRNNELAHHQPRSGKHPSGVILCTRMPEFGSQPFGIHTSLAILAADTAAVLSSLKMNLRSHCHHSTNSEAHRCNGTDWHLIA